MLYICPGPHDSVHFGLCTLYTSVPYLLDGVKQSPIAVDHNEHWNAQAEYKQADDVGMRLCGALGP